MKYLLLIVTAFFIVTQTSAQTFTRKDSLQGGLRFERTCFDVSLYHLGIEVNIEDKSIKGVSRIFFQTVKKTNKIQIDLFENMKIDSIYEISKSGRNKLLNYKRDNNAVFINLIDTLEVNKEAAIFFYYSGKPLEAKNAPWDGGFVWKKDKNGKPFIGVAVQGTGASLWFPCKDSQSDEPDYGMIMDVTIPSDLVAVSNGRLIAKPEEKNNKKTWTWMVKNPINSYNITLNIADYVHIHDNHKGLDLDYYVLSYNEEKARKHFEEVKPMMDCFQSKFGDYPFKEDGYKLVETPYLGMEHQSAVAYGNKYLKGYLGSDLSGTGVGLLFDFITIHESGHEWFGNNITTNDLADMWVHEGFTNYSETLFVDYIFGNKAGSEYNFGIRKGIRNDKPIIPEYGVNAQGSGDMYPKGGNMLHSIRHGLDNDELFRSVLRGLNQNFYHKTVSSAQVESYFSKKAGFNYAKVFDQYLRTVQVPVFEYYLKDGKAFYRYSDCVKGFNLPLSLKKEGIKTLKIIPSQNWQQVTLAKGQDALFTKPGIEFMYYLQVKNTK